MHSFSAENPAFLAGLKIISSRHPYKDYKEFTTFVKLMQIAYTE